MPSALTHSALGSRNERLQSSRSHRQTHIPGTALPSCAPSTHPQRPLRPRDRHVHPAYVRHEAQAASRGGGRRPDAGHHHHVPLLPLERVHRVAVQRVAPCCACCNALKGSDGRVRDRGRVQVRARAIQGTICPAPNAAFTSTASGHASCQRMRWLGCRAGAL